MAYCVNCGVELQKGEPCCPLCGVISVNPLETPSEANAAARPYPVHVETLSRRIDRRYTAIFISLLLLIPLCICAVCDLLIDGRLSWSAYVLGGLGLVFIWFLLPFFFKRRRAVKCALLDGAAAIGMLSIIAHMSGGNWLWTLGAPLAVFATAYGLLLVWLSMPALSWSPFVRAGVACIGTGLMTVLIELCIMFYRGAFHLPHWSAYSFFPCLILGVGLLLLDKRKGAKEQLERRFFV